ANIMVDTQGRVKVADFGLMKVANDGGDFTQSSLAVGTPDFVAPESLIAGMPVDGRADLYAVGVTLYQMLTGHVPRGAWRPASVMAPGVDPRFDQIIVKAMQLSRDERHGSAMELRAHLDSLLMPAAPAPDAQRHSNAPTTVKSKTRMMTGMGMAAVLAAGAFLMMSGHDTRAPGGNVAKPMTSLSPAPMLALKEGYTNTLGMKFLPIEGTDVMFCIHETRHQDYAAYSADTPGVDGRWMNQNNDGFTLTENTEQHPVTKVGWEDAQKFCQWLGKKEGKTYRLPTDREWSIAVGIGRQEIWEKDTTPVTVIRPQKVFPWGLKWPPPKSAGNYSDASRQAKAPMDSASYIDSYDDGYPTTAPVMSYMPNTVGLYDMGGNVCEWCEDWYDATKQDRVVRGGDWKSYKRDDLYSSYRDHYAPVHINHNRGFRVVLLVESGG
ncbi:MAG: SUMF1/EgtB/PvdO family nonheme iron enzyme, partial [Prosthecobacter sp.]|nr:SUMF1/EgtB/PvdO family nonheme iron enzyme [Prosthecobacter sp.]